MPSARVTALHGFSQSPGSWDEVAALAGGVWLAPPVTATSLEQAADDVVAGWDAAGIDRSHLVGYSQGGRIALNLAVRRPERLLTLTVISAHAGFEGTARAARREADERLAERIEEEGIDWFADYWAARPMFAGLAARGPEILARLDADRRRNDARLLAAQLRGLGAGACQPLWDRLDGVGVAALVIAGGDDPAYAEHARRLGEHLPEARVEVVPGAGHAVHLERPQLVAGLIAAHISTR